ncbi:type II toxin-antitoxin system HicB family antitoxin [Trichococcus pasteurii]|uniref:HicB-like antitoxin of toxin-antitoxin system domain-containing protein n=1 Tax=Trichococcus pasteurii TaxID=43064 RepID=A0A1W1IEN2_9LACT|nr:type II toxin-antitoxin system HicB family antitoxin [Trichococcus pasteurii]SFE14506.1 HicB_like antitoxin of toxin-antitoxin system [Trichococcus pasteurii]SLM51488.1 Hypothetical protein TPAS_1164 [Trichococcus pasteurii]SSB92369.1 Hypothetical protein TPAS_1164 [Trichococcus pasteurii]
MLMVQTHYVAYPAILDDRENVPGTYTVTFPNVPGAISEGIGITDALATGAEALALMLYDEKELPTASFLSDVQADNPEAIVSYIMVDLVAAAKKVQLVEPTSIINSNKAETVIPTTPTYEELVKRNREFEEKLFYSQLNNKIKEGSGELIPSEKVIESDQVHNPFTSLSDKDLFD